MLITVDLDVDPALPGFEVVRISNYGDLTPSRQQHLGRNTDGEHHHLGIGRQAKAGSQSYGHSHPGRPDAWGDAEKKLAKSQ